MIDKEQLLKLKVGALAFMFQALLGLIFVIFDDRILYNTDIVLLMGIGSLIISSVSLTSAIVLMWIVSMYKKIKKNKSS